jgi:hypothetical protein
LRRKRAARPEGGCADGNRIEYKKKNGESVGQERVLGLEGEEEGKKGGES